MRANLPLEVWVDILCFPWIHRLLMARLVDRIGSREFAEALQFYLHDWGRRMLDDLEIKAGNENPQQSCLLAKKQGYRQCEFPESELSMNIKKFRYILIRHFDRQSLDFLGKLEHLFTNVKLSVNIKRPRQAANMRNALGHMFQLIGGIFALLFENELSLDCVQQSYPEAFKYAKMLHFNDCLMSKKIVAFVLQWLGEERVGYKPRLCVINSLLKKQTQEIARSIQENFLASTIPSTFAVFLLDDKNITEFQVQNGKTNEQLSGKYTTLSLPNGEEITYFKICRYHCAEEAYLDAWLEANAGWNWVDPIEQADQLIQLYQPTIGHIDENADQNEVNDGKRKRGQDEDGQQGTSSAAKKARID